MQVGAVRRGAAGASAVSSALIDHWTHVGAERKPISPAQKGICWSVSWPSFGAFEAVSMTSWICSRPLMPPSEEKPASHLSPFFSAMKPPFSQM